mmetsp:Transcript_47724/g.79180  ORF Transcript_47724/g.79180 Transcript_47724/m.79180 type:complete len:302 (-) Transcript_47724:22-927(-)
MPRLCCWKFSLSTFGWCCCCCTVPTSNADLPLLDPEKQLQVKHEFGSSSTAQENLTQVRELYVKQSYFERNNKQATKSRIRLVCTSDTHMHHDRMKMPPGDCLIVAGDITNWRSTTENLPRVLQWLKSLTQYEYKVVIAGNHEVRFNENDAESTKQLFQSQADAIYLQDSACEVYGLKIYGTPWHPKRGCFFHAEAFAKPTKDLQQIFAQIPSDTDILISHVPPYGIRDYETAGHIGSDSLLENSKDRVKPIMHIFGHVHGTNGLSYIQDCETLFVNTATRVNVFDIVCSEDSDEYKVEQE